MNKMKILSPAGDMESLRTAIFNGADEIYLGIKGFNARNIEGFDLTSLKTAVDFAHIYNVRVFLAVNILFSDDEIQQALDIIIDAYNLGVDAFIIQDIGLAHILHTHYPQIEIHASTQMGIHNLEGVIQAEKLGFSRVVLARETPLDEIKRIHENSDIEIEYFVQGALCVSFSGNCYLSSYLFDASGNRGKCKQLCRLPYRLKYEDEVLKYGYLLSAKDFCMIDRLDDLRDAGVTSLKIEGRARRPYYVGVATKMYRDAIDGLNINKEDIKLGFNRGYTQGYFNGNSGIISYIQNHTGISIGKVEKFIKGKTFNEIFISSNRDLNKKSAFKFFRQGKEICTISAFDLEKRGDLYRITTKQIVCVGDRVNLISDNDKEQELLNKITKRDIKIYIQAKEGERLFAKTEIDGKTIEQFGDILDKAKSSPISNEELENNFNKNDYFTAKITADIGEAFIQKSKLNEFRRQFFEKVISALTNIENRNLKHIYIEKTKANIEELENFQIVSSTDEEFINNNIILNPEIYNINQIQDFQNKCKKENKNAILSLPNFALSQDIKMLKTIIEKTKISVLINNLYAIDFDTTKYIGGGLNIYNRYTSNYFNLPYITAEKGKTKSPFMTLRHCPMKEHLGADCSNCPYKDGYYYKMENGTILKLKRTKMSTCTFYLTE